MFRIAHTQHPRSTIVKDIFGIHEIEEEVEYHWRVLLLHLLNLRDKLFYTDFTLFIHITVHERAFQPNYMPKINLERPYTVHYLHLSCLVEVGPAHEFDHVGVLQVPEQAAPNVVVAGDVFLQVLVRGPSVFDGQLPLARLVFLNLDVFASFLEIVIFCCLLVSHVLIDHLHVFLRFDVLLAPLGPDLRHNIIVLYRELML